MFKRHDSSVIPRPNNHVTFQYSLIRRLLFVVAFITLWYNVTILIRSLYFCC